MRSLLAAVAVVSAVGLLLVGLSFAATPFVAPTGCAYAGGGALPDARCTPGATNQAVTQRTIRSTICTSGYTATIRPAEKVTEPEKYKLMASYGWPKGTSARLFELDHLISLELGGGANDAANLFPERHDVNVGGLDEGSLVKDALENKLAAIVCSPHPLLTLRRAQAAIRKDWVAAYSRWMGWSSSSPATVPAPVSLPPYKGTP